MWINRNEQTTKLHTGETKKEHGPELLVGQEAVNEEVPPDQPQPEAICGLTYAEKEKRERREGDGWEPRCKVPV